MDRSAVSSLVRDMLAGYRSEPSAAGNTIGVPWPAENVSTYLEALHAALVEPYLQRFELRETSEQIGQAQPSYAEYWVRAEGGGYLEWYDPATGEFGLGLRGEGAATPVSIGVRGDLVGVFCGM
jgi:hypothetical protein